MSHTEECNGHCHCHEQDSEVSLKIIVVSFLLFIAALLLEHISFFKDFLSRFSLGEISLYRISFVVPYMISYILCGKNVLKGALENIRHREFFDEKFLMSIASLGAVFTGELGEAVAVMLFWNIGEFFQDYAVDKSKKSISALMEIRPDKARVLRNGVFTQIKAEDVKSGEVIQVRSGERVALDGIIVSGDSFVDTSALTGESVPRKVHADDDVLAGFVNKEGVLEIKVTGEYGQSAVSRILELTKEASEVKAKSEKFITKFAKIYTPLVCFAALLTAFVPPLFIKIFFPELFADNTFRIWIYRALMFLVVSCPCALVISVPLSFFSGIGEASRHGILIKGSNFIEALAKAQTAVFDKTGTLTKGIFAVKKVYCMDKENEDELIALAAHAENFSNHPVSLSIKNAHGHCKDCDSISAENFEELAGLGIKITINGKKIAAGNEKLMAQEGIFLPQKNEDHIGTTVYIAQDGIFKGWIVIGDEIKEDSLKAIRGLKKCGIKKTVMLTGDNQAVAQITARDLEIDEVFSNLMPEDKVLKVEELMKEKEENKKTGTILFAGDGVNDSPVLARCDVGISMGNFGSEAAIEASDVVLMDDKPSRILKAIKISRKTMAIIKENIVLSLGVKALIMILGVAGVSNMWFAVFGDVGVCFIAILNAMRISSPKNKYVKSRHANA